MVRVNLINPRNLTDQHLVAEYLEILMLVTYVRKNPNITDKEKIPKNYRLGKGHIIFFKNKLIYLKKRHELIRKEMRKRGFKTNKKVNITGFNKNLKYDWKPNRKDKEIIKRRLIARVRKKPTFYSYYGKKRKLDFFIKLIKKG